MLIWEWRSCPAWETPTPFRLNGAADFQLRTGWPFQSRARNRRCGALYRHPPGQPAGRAGARGIAPRRRSMERGNSIRKWNSF